MISPYRYVWVNGALGAEPYTQTDKTPTKDTKTTGKPASVADRRHNNRASRS